MVVTGSSYCCSGGSARSLLVGTALEVTNSYQVPQFVRIVYSHCYDVYDVYDVYDGCCMMHSKW
jgi:hypothetical protein